jgi:nicotinamide riboside kinase
MKIAFIGTHGVGKTTLCFELAACLKRLDVGVDVVKEVARNCPLPINRETTSDSQLWILHTQIAREIELSQAYEAIVCDRAVLDNYAYMVHAVGRLPQLEPMVIHWMRSYRLLVRVPVIQPPSFDGTRDVSVEFQLSIDQILCDLLAEFSIDYLDLATDDRENWVKHVLKALDLPADAPQMDLFNGLGAENNR